MYEIKNRIYPDFDKTQKSGVCNYLRSLTKQNLNMTVEELVQKFIDDETYYLELNSSRFPFLSEKIDDAQFIHDTKEYIKECKKYYEYKQSQKPIIEANKIFEKKKRKFLQELKMSKEPPTKKQLYYYEKLCKRYNLEQNNTKEMSKLDLKNEIEKVINEHKSDYTTTD